MVGWKAEGMGDWEEMGGQKAGECGEGRRMRGV